MKTSIALHQQFKIAKNARHRCTPYLALNWYISSVAAELPLVIQLYASPSVLSAASVRTALSSVPTEDESTADSVAAGASDDSSP